VTFYLEWLAEIAADAEEAERTKNGQQEMTAENLAGLGATVRRI
jgi:hypothetical protein